MRFRYHKYTQKPGLWLQQQILPVQTPISMRQKAIDRLANATVKLLLVGRYGSEIDGKQQLPAGASQQVTEAIVASVRCSNRLCGCRCFTCCSRY
ncbi:hypothetical protein IQ269_25410 [Tychonema sp. LEGE 07199]|nr:hypothetical protein [Tychonema sp. LEGE 07196]MBE9124048.1 hypothetical protein [Tychonema sp. LEGE 07199]MBE9134196.1 hypothetical protein [Tychonema sp. LEGE 07196]